MYSDDSHYPNQKGDGCTGHPWHERQLNGSMGHCALMIRRRREIKGCKCPVRVRIPRNHWPYPPQSFFTISCRLTRLSKRERVCWTPRTADKGSEKFQTNCKGPVGRRATHGMRKGHLNGSVGHHAPLIHLREEIKAKSDLDVSAVRLNLRMEDDLAGLFEFADFDDVIRQKSYCDVRRKGLKGSERMRWIQRYETTVLGWRGREERRDECVGSRGFVLAFTSLSENKLIHPKRTVRSIQEWGGGVVYQIFYWGKIDRERCTRRTLPELRTDGRNLGMIDRHLGSPPLDPSTHIHSVVVLASPRHSLWPSKHPAIPQKLQLVQIQMAQKACVKYFVSQHFHVSPYLVREPLALPLEKTRRRAKHPGWLGFGWKQERAIARNDSCAESPSQVRQPYTIESGRAPPLRPHELMDNSNTLRMSGGQFVARNSNPAVMERDSGPIDVSMAAVPRPEAQPNADSPDEIIFPEDEDDYSGLLNDGIGKDCELTVGDDQQVPEEDIDQTDPSAAGGGDSEQPESSTSSPKRNGVPAFALPDWLMNPFKANVAASAIRGTDCLPALYRDNKSFWFPVQDPFFALENLESLAPEQMFLPSFFLWDPDALLPNDIRGKSGMAQFEPSLHSKQRHRYLAALQGTRKPVLPIWLPSPEIKGSGYPGASYVGF
ncbi:hypothetical protein B0H13DRAFT_1929427 [Mycena leptocephala]|nr:hypothetical protein B0H13DRAFT_1929427 [Mycena leptocephala]